MKPPKVGAPKEEHERYAKEFLDDDEYKEAPPGGVETDESGIGEGPDEEEDDTQG